MYAYVLYTIFRCEFNGSVHFIIRLTIFGNFSKCAIYIPPGPVLQSEFNCDVYFGVRVTILSNFFVLYMYICYTPFFSVNSVITVIISSGEYILIIYDMVITSHD